MDQWVAYAIRKVLAHFAGPVARCVHEPAAGGPTPSCGRWCRRAARATRPRARCATAWAWPPRAPSRGRTASRGSSTTPAGQASPPPAGRGRRGPTAAGATPSSGRTASRRSTSARTAGSAATTSWASRSNWLRPARPRRRSRPTRTGSRRSTRRSSTSRCTSRLDWTSETPRAPPRTGAVRSQARPAGGRDARDDPRDGRGLDAGRGGARQAHAAGRGRDRHPGQRRADGDGDARAGAGRGPAWPSRPAAGTAPAPFRPEVVPAAGGPAVLPPVKRAPEVLPPAKTPCGSATRRAGPTPPGTGRSSMTSRRSRSRRRWRGTSASAASMSGGGCSRGCSRRTISPGAGRTRSRCRARWPRRGRSAPTRRSFEAAETVRQTLRYRRFAGERRRQTLEDDAVRQACGDDAQRLDREMRAQHRQWQRHWDVLLRHDTLLRDEEREREVRGEDAPRLQERARPSMPARDRARPGPEPTR